MKFICLLIVALLINFQNIFSQNYQTPSCDMIDNNESTLSRTMALAGSSGAYKPAKNSAGEYFRVLIAFAQFDSDVEPNPVWPLNQLPTWANSFIDNTVLSTYSDETLSDFFDEASHGSFDFIGDIYPNLVHITSDKSYGEANLDVITELNINITDFSRYDNWDLTGSSYIFSEGSGDGYLDMLIIIYRRKHSTLGLSGGISTLNLASDFTTHDGKVIKGGYYPSKERGGITSVNKFSPKFDYITHIAHEFGHYLFGVNHTIQGGLMAGTQSNEMPSYYGSTYMMSGWEREWLRYTNYIVPTTDGQEITIGDFVETGDVIKIPIPFNNPTSSTFFVIENHQRLSKYDQINKGGEFEGNYNFTTVGSGIYIWLITNGNNWVPSVDIKTADGSWDWALDGTISMPSGWPATMPLAKRTAVNRNTGKSDRNVLNIYWNGQWWDKWHENINPNISSPPTSNYILNRDVFGDGTDAFNLAYNQLFTPWSNPSSYAGGTSNISLELISNNAGMYNVKVYSTDASALALPPSKPQDFFASYNSSNQTVLTWAGNTETDLASYKIYRAKTTGGVPSTYQYLATVAGTTTTYTDTTFIGDQAYKVFYKITAVDNTNKESIQSDYSFINYLSANITTSTSICGNIIAYNDINIPSGVTLTIITNTTNPIAKLNLLNNSVLNVYGQLTSTTTWNPNKVIFDFQSPFISEQKINGIRLYPGSFFYVYAAHFKNAYCGIICKDCSPYQGNFLYTNCFFENMEVIGGSITSTYLQGHYLVEENLIVAGNDLTIDPPSYFLFLNGSSLISNGELYINGGEFDFFQPNEVTGNGIIGGANIDHAHILCAYNGIYPGAKLTNSTITGCNYGIIFNGFDVDYFYGNSIVNNNYGIYMVLAAAMMDQNSISYNYITGLTSTIGSYPVLIDGGWNWGRNLIRGNNCGIKIRRHSSGFLGCGGVPGQNWFDENSNLDIDIDETSIIAEGNYWRGINPYTSPYVSDLSGNSDFNNWLTDQSLRSVNNDELKIEKSVSNYGSANNRNSSQKSSSSYLNNANNNSTSSSSLKDVFNFLKNKDYENVKKLSKEILNKDLDSKYALSALNLYKIASNKLNEKESLSNYLSELYNTKEKKPIYAVAGLMQSLNEKGDKKLSLIENVITKYSGYDVVEMALFDKLLYYLFDKREREKAKEVLVDLEKQFPEGDYTKDAKDFFVAFKPDRNLKSMPVTNSITKKVSEIEKPSEYKLIGNYPNPFNPSTTIKYALPKESTVELRIYDMMGREVRTLVTSTQVAGYKEMVWDGRNSSGSQVSSGIYLYRLIAKSLEDGKTFEKSAKLIMMK